MYTTILFVWTIVAADAHSQRQDWRALAEFHTPTACEEAIKRLKIETRAVCIRKGEKP